MTIEQRYELEKTLAGLELNAENRPVGVPIGVEDRFMLRKVIGHGSMGVVYLAEDIELERNIAIKVVSKGIEHGRWTLRLRREARALAALDHPNVLKIFDVGNEYGEPFIAMEYVEGSTLRAWQNDRRLEPALEAYLQAGRGLAAAHAHGLVHRDFKPDNVLVDEVQGRLRVRVADFGLAGDEPEDDSSAESTETEPSLTSKGLLGTLVYMAPEQLRRERADARSDQHQFCVALWEAITGTRPFEPPSRPLAGDTAVPSCPAVMPRWVYRILRRGLAFDRDARYPSMDALLATIERGRLSQRWRSRLAMGGLVVTAGIGTWGATRTDPCEGVTAPVATIWTAAARADLETAFERDSQNGGRMAQYLVERLDRASAQWSEHALSICEATQHASSSDRLVLEDRAECLERWAQRMASRIEWLRHPEGPRIDQAFELVAPLAYVGDSCALPPVIIDAMVEEAIERAEQAEFVRDLHSAKTLATEAVELARERGTPCLTEGPDGEERSSEQAAALFRLGHVLSERRESQASLEALSESHEHAYACKDEHRDAEARILAAKVLALDFSDAKAAQAVLDDAWVALGHVEEPSVSLRRYDERMAAGIVAEQGGDYEGARRYAEEGRDALGVPSPDPLLEAKLDLNIGIAYQREGRYVDANTAFEQAIQRVSGALGDQHPRTRLYAARRALNLGLAALKAGEPARMRQYLREAAASDEIPIAIKAVTAWAQGEYEAGNAQEASAQATALLALLGLDHGLSPVSLANAETTAGQILAAVGDPRGIPALESACPKWWELGKPDNIGACEVMLGSALRYAGRLDDARRVLERLLLLEVSETGPLPSAIDELARSLKSWPTAPGPTPSTPRP